MTLILLATVLILAMVAFLASQGLFSAMILAVLSILCAALALNTYPVLGAVLAPYQGAYADGVAAIALFVVPLIIARALVDLIVRRNVSFGLWTDRIGAGAFGLLAALVLVGTAVVIMQMLPFGDAVLGYRAYDDSLQRDSRVWPFCPDDVAVGLARAVSGGALTSPASFEKVHDDFLLECFAARNTAGKNGSLTARPGSLTIKGAWQPPPEQADWVAKVPDNPGGGKGKVIVIACATDAFTDDPDGWMRLAGTQFRLATEPAPPSRLPGGRAAAAAEPPAEGPIRYRSYYPLGYLAAPADSNAWRFVPPPVKAPDPPQFARLIVEQERARAIPVYWVYRIGEKEQPSYVVFRRAAQQEAPKLRSEVPKVERPATKPAKEEGGKTTKTTPKTKKEPAKTTKEPAKTTKEPATAKAPAKTAKEPATAKAPAKTAKAPATSKAPAPQSQERPAP